MSATTTAATSDTSNQQQMMMEYQQQNVSKNNLIKLVSDELLSYPNNAMYYATNKSQ